MFAPPIAKAKTTASSNGKSALRRATPFGHHHGAGSVEHLLTLQRSIGNQAVLRLLRQRGLLKNGHDNPEQDAGQENMSARGEPPRGAWDFSKIPLSPPGRMGGYQPPSSLPAPRLPGPIQAKLEVGAVNDPLEHEADRVAEQVMRMPEGQLQLQRACACGNRAMGGECGECGEKSRLALRATLRAGEPDDSHEREADRIGDRAGAAPAPHDLGGAPPRIRRISGPSSGRMDAAPASVGRVLASPGTPLEPALRRDMEWRFGRDFSQVRVHSDVAAQRSAAEVDALAYTVGRDIVFGADQFAPGTRAGRRLIAHELTHVVQQPGARDIPQPSFLRRTPTPPKANEGCNIKDAQAYIYFEIDRRFRDPSDPQVIKRANCLKQAFTMLSPDDAVYFARQIIAHDRKNLFYAGYETLATPTRVALAEILVDIISRKGTEAYLARLLFGAAVTLYGDPKIERPAIVTANVNGDHLEITLDKEVEAFADAEVLGSSECEKYIFGFTQFATDSNFVIEYYSIPIRQYIVIDKGADYRRSLPCQDVFRDGDVWSYSTHLDCASKKAEKSFDKTHRFSFSDTPTRPASLLPDKPEMLLSGVTWTNKYITIFSVMLPNGVVHHMSWFTWSIEYCENYPMTTVGKRPDNSSGRQVTIDDIRSGNPPAPYAKLVGKPAAKSCNSVAQNAKADTFAVDSPLIKCR